jgi:quercetin dioxygenase-like cupin family protein
MANRELSCEAHHQVQARNQNPVHRNQGGQVQLVLVTGPKGQGGDQHSTDPQAPAL